MSAKFKLVRANENPAFETDLDWSKCMFCQCQKKKTLRFPATISRFDTYGYEKLAANLMSFQALNALPKSLQFSKSNDTLEIQKKCQQITQNFTKLAD